MQRMLLGFCLLVMLPNLSVQLTETGKRVSITDGNELHGWCQSYKDAVKAKEGEIRISKSTDASLAFEAGECIGYVRGIVESLPAGETFSPGPNVRLTQYVDVVFKYLDEHPEMRDKDARILVQSGLVQAFPNRREQ